MLFLTACGPNCKEPSIKPDPLPHIDPTDTLPNLGQIQFNNMQIGQRSRYLFFAIPNTNDTTTLIDYRPDTLVVAVAGQDAQGYLIREFMTRGSVSYDSMVNPVLYGDSVLTYHLRVENDSLYIINPNVFWSVASRIFVTPDQALPLTPITSPQTTFVGWQTTLPSDFSSSYVPAYVANFTHWGQAFDHLNIIWDGRQTASDGNRFLFAYSPDHGLVRWATRGSFFQVSGYGWDLLPE